MKIEKIALIGVGVVAASQLLRGRSMSYTGLGSPLATAADVAAQPTSTSSQQDVGVPDISNIPESDLMPLVSPGTSGYVAAINVPLEPGWTTRYSDEFIGGSLTVNVVGDYIEFSATGTVNSDRQGKAITGRVYVGSEGYQIYQSIVGTNVPVWSGAMHNSGMYSFGNANVEILARYKTNPS